MFLGVFFFGGKSKRREGCIWRGWDDIKFATVEHNGGEMLHDGVGLDMKVT